jgi:hypothetical protein
MITNEAAALMIALRALQEIADTDCFAGQEEDAPLPAWITAANALQEIRREFYFNGETAYPIGAGRKRRPMQAKRGE